MWKYDPVSRAPVTFRYVKDAKEALGDDYGGYLREKRTVLDPPENCLHSIKHTVRRIMKDTNAGEMQIYLGGEDNFRNRITGDYKAGRPPKPEYYELARDYMLEFMNAEVVHGQEVDDKLAQEQTPSTVICSIDKDLLQVPGSHYNWVTRSWTHILKEEGDEWFWIQMLVGDNVDNITGIDGIGIIKAIALVQMFDGNLRQVRGFVQAVYLQEFKSMKQFFDNSRLLYIRRDIEHVSTAQIMVEVV